MRRLNHCNQREGCPILALLTDSTRWTRRHAHSPVTHLSSASFSSSRSTVKSTSSVEVEVNFNEELDDIEV